MFPVFDESRQLPMFGEWSYRRLPAGELVDIPPSVCPRGHSLGPGRCRLIWDPGLRETILCCQTCYDTDPGSAMFRAEVPKWKKRFNALVNAGRKVEAMALINTVLPVPSKPGRRRGVQPGYRASEAGG